MVWFKKRDHPDRLFELFGSVLSKHVCDLFWRAKLHLELPNVYRSPKKTTEAFRGMRLFAVGQSDACQSPFARQILPHQGESTCERGQTTSKLVHAWRNVRGLRRGAWFSAHRAKGHVLQCCQERTPLLATISLILGPHP